MTSGTGAGPGPAGVGWAERPIGAHIRTTAARADLAIERMVRVAAEAVQIFSANPRSWGPSLKPRRDAAAVAQDHVFAEACHGAGIPIFMHSPYLVNLASRNPEVVVSSVAALAFAVARGAPMGVRGVVFHAGSVGRDSGVPRETGLRSVAAALLPLLDAIPDDGPDLLVEPTAGTGGSLAATVSELAAYLDAVGPHPRLGVCLDTCHLHAAGHDLASPAGMAAALDEVAAVCGDRLRLVHANDSTGACGSNLDRHATIGEGTIGAAPFGELFRHPGTRGTAVVVETPDSGGGQARDVATLRELRARASGGGSSDGRPG